MKDNIEQMTITELTKEAKKRMIAYELDAGAVIDGMYGAAGLLSDSECESKLASLTTVLVEQMAAFHSSLISDMGGLLNNIADRAEAMMQAGMGKKKGAVEA